MKISILLPAVFSALAQSAATSGCGNPLSSQLTQGGASQTNSLNFTTSGGVLRSYLLHIPSSYNINTPAPIAFSYHGRTETPQDQESISGMSNETMNPNYLVVYPQGIDLQWQGDPAAVGYDDIGFTMELLANLSSTFCIDSARVYAVGKSNGGGFAANVLACDPQASRIFAGFAGASGAYYQGTTDVGCTDATVTFSCNPGRYPVPIFTTHGDADTTIPYTGGGRRGRCLPSIPLFMTSWAVRNSLGSSNTSVSLYNNNVVRYDYGNASFPQLSAHYYVHGLGHTWPSLAAGSPFDATPLLLSFWNKWTLDSTPYNFVNATTSATTTSVPTSAYTSTSSTTTPTSSIPSTSLCPSANGQSIVDSNNNTYLVTCSADNSVGSYANTQASASYLDCMNACDAAISNGCVGFTYVGGTNGVGSGTCWLKKSMGTYPASGSNTISAVRVLGGSPGNSVSSAASSTSSTASSSASFSAAPTTSALSCPASNNQIYTYAANGAQFVIECGIDHSGGDMASTSVKNFEGCIAACATTSGCVDVSLSGSACYLKKTLGAAVTNSGILGARYIGIASSSSASSSTASSTSSSALSSLASSASSSSSFSSSFSTSSSSSLSSSSSSSTSSSSSLSSTTAATSVVSISSTSVASASLSSSSSTSSVLPSVGADGYTTTSYPPTCTAINTNIYAVTDNAGKPYLYMCGGGSAGNTVSTLAIATMDVLDSVTTKVPLLSFASTANLLSTRIAGYIRPITTTSSSVATSSSATTTASTLSTSISSSSSTSSSSATPSMTSFSTSTIPSSSAAISSSGSSSSSSSVASSSAGTSSGGPSASSSSVVSSSSASSTVVVPSSIPIAAPSCPASNGTVYTDAGGLQYIILCTYDTSVNTISASSDINSFGSCAVLCDSTSGCTGLTWNGAVCSLKQSFGQYILGATRV
ncbi:alpha/beta-hydrolase, partial [Aureobasidium melanogenum]